MAFPEIKNNEIKDIKDPLHVYHFVVAHENDGVPPLYRAQLMNNDLTHAALVMGGLHYDLRFGQQVSDLAGPTAPVAADLLIVDVHGMDSSTASTLQPLKDYLKKHTQTPYGIITMEEYEKSIKRAGFKNVIAHSATKERKIEFAGRLLLAAHDARLQSAHH